ncbi:MAG TPA: peptide deformylase [Bacteroidota bacterium]|nr:peptide deformylase [Bacteroidota bacterium]
MSVLPIHLFGSDALRAKAKPVRSLDDSVVKLIYDMFETMRSANGIGLAATQVGDLRRVIVIDITETEPKEEGEEVDPAKKTSPELPRTLVLINPEVVGEEGTWSMEEGCLSIPEVRADVERAGKVRVRFRDADFREQELLMDGILARVALHEIDHINGVLFIDRIPRPVRNTLKPQLRKIKKGEVETSYPVVNGVEV